MNIELLGETLVGRPDLSDTKSLGQPSHEVAKVELIQDVIMANEKLGEEQDTSADADQPVVSEPYSVVPQEVDDGGVEAPPIVEVQEVEIQEVDTQAFEAPDIAIQATADQDEPPQQEPLSQELTEEPPQETAVSAQASAASSDEAPAAVAPLSATTPPTTPTTEAQATATAPQQAEAQATAAEASSTIATDQTTPATPPSEEQATTADSATAVTTTQASSELQSHEQAEHHTEPGAGEVDDESGGEVAEVPAVDPMLAFQAAAATTAATFRPLPRPQKKSQDLKAIVAPILMTVGVMLLVPALWSVLVLMGASVPMSGREDSNSMAKMMLLCWPLAISLIVPAAMIFIQISDAKRREARKAAMV